MTRTRRRKVVTGGEANRSSQRSMTGGGRAFWWPGKEQADVGKREARFCSEPAQWLGSQVVFLYLVLDLNFFPKALSSSGTDRVRVTEPSDSDLTTRAWRWQRGGKDFNKIMTHITICRWILTPKRQILDPNGDNAAHIPYQAVINPAITVL